MERGSDKHGPRMDDALQSEVAGMLRAGHQTHAEEWKLAEPSGEDQPDVDRVPDGTRAGGVPEGMTAEDVETRSELATYLRLSAFPGDAAALREEAAANEAPVRVVDLLGALPEGPEYANVGEVWVAVGGGVEAHRA